LAKLPRRPSSKAWSFRSAPWVRPTLDVPRPDAQAAGGRLRSGGWCGGVLLSDRRVAFLNVRHAPLHRGHWRVARGMTSLWWRSSSSAWRSLLLRQDSTRRLGGNRILDRERSARKTVSEAAAHLAKKGLTQEGAPPLARFITAVASRFSAVIGEEARPCRADRRSRVRGCRQLLFMNHFRKWPAGILWSGVSRRNTARRWWSGRTRIGDLEPAARFSRPKGEGRFPRPSGPVFSG